jgi:hypothetical protein
MIKLTVISLLTIHSYCRVVTLIDASLVISGWSYQVNQWTGHDTRSMTHISARDVLSVTQPGSGDDPLSKRLHLLW